MKKYIPKMYQKNVFDINYKKLKKMGIKVLAFDLDNTLLLIDKEDFSKEILSLLQDLQKDFKIAIITNNTLSRVKKIKFTDVEIVTVVSAFKPSSFGFRRLIKRLKCNREDVCMIGDQLVTDILGGNRFGLTTVLVDSLGKKDLKITSFNRIIEKRKLKKLKEEGLLERGKYYE